MSFHTWHIYGFGIRTDELKVDSIERIESLLSCAPEVQEKIHDYFETEDITNPTVEDYKCYEGDGYNLGFATILQEVILAAENLQLTACEDFDECHYLVYEPSYPWNMNEVDLSITEDTIKNILLKYVSILTDTSVEVEYQEVENGG